MKCNQNENSIGLIYCYKGFSRCAQLLSATKVGGATAIQKDWVKKPWDLGDLWQPVSDWYTISTF